ncbi:MAG: hypothetical protein QOD98_2530 [Nocardioidaceae bacterium]|nr:hypothetical protein [Nocardioidaceae bacterium]
MSNPPPANPALDAYLAGLVDHPVLDPGAVPAGARMDEWGTLLLDPPYDARQLAAAWRVQRPLAVSTDVMQRSWYLFERGADLPDEYATRAAGDPVRAGDKTLRAQFTARPDGPLPELVVGPSPAYDVTEVGGWIDRIELS